MITCDLRLPTTFFFLSVTTQRSVNMSSWMSTSAWMKNLIGTTPAVSGESIANLIKTVKSGSKEDRKKALSDLNKLAANQQSAKVNLFCCSLIFLTAHWRFLGYIIGRLVNRDQ
jgi:hypothetical protein